MVAYDGTGILHTVNWRTFMVGAQYYLPPSGRVFITGNYTHAQSNNIQSLVPDCAAVMPVPPCLNHGTTFWRAQYFDVNLFVDITEAARAAVSYQLTKQDFADAGKTKRRGKNGAKTRTRGSNWRCTSPSEAAARRGMSPRVARERIWPYHLTARPAVTSLHRFRSGWSARARICGPRALCRPTSLDVKRGVG